jgi:deoxyribodipyrimidine photo-lyase
MSRDQRVRDNWALIFAQELALQREQPLAVVFCLVPRFLGATMRQYGFMLKGLQEVEQVLQEKDIGFALVAGRPQDEIPAVVHDCGAGALVADFDPLRVKREWKDRVVKKMGVSFYEVDAHNIVPCWEASPKKEYAARTSAVIARTLREVFPSKYDGRTRSDGSGSPAPDACGA